MACDTPATLLPPVRTLLLARSVSVRSKGGTAPAESDVFVLSDERTQPIAPLVDALRVTLTVEDAATAFRCRPVLQATDDAITRSPPFDLDTDRSGDGTRTSAWANAPDMLRRALRIGVIAGRAGIVTRRTTPQARPTTPTHPRTRCGSHRHQADPGARLQGR